MKNPFRKTPKSLMYVSLEFNPKIIDSCIEKLLKAFNEKWELYDNYQAEGGVIFLLVKY